MEHFRPLSITNLSAINLENIRRIGTVKVYAIASVTGGPQRIPEFRTSVDEEGETNPRWVTPIDFTLHDPSLQNNLLCLVFEFYCKRTLGDKSVGRVEVPVKTLFDMFSANRTASQAHPVVKSSGREQGSVHFCFKFGDPIQQSPQQPTPPDTPAFGAPIQPSRQQPTPPYTPQPPAVSGIQTDQVWGNSPYPYGSTSEQPVPNQANYYSDTAPDNHHDHDQDQGEDEDENVLF